MRNMSYLQTDPGKQTQEDFRFDLYGTRSRAVALTVDSVGELGAVPRKGDFHCEQIDALKDDLGSTAANACVDHQPAAALSKTEN